MRTFWKKSFYKIMKLLMNSEASNHISLVPANRIYILLWLLWTWMEWMKWFVSIIFSKTSMNFWKFIGFDPINNKGSEQRRSWLWDRPTRKINSSNPFLKLQKRNLFALFVFRILLQCVEKHPTHQACISSIFDQDCEVHWVENKNDL